MFRFQFSGSIPVGFFVGLFVGSIILTSIFNFSKGSVAACILFHLTNNIASAFDKAYIVATVNTGFVALAVYIVVKYKTKNLADSERVKNYFLRKKDKEGRVSLAGNKKPVAQQVSTGPVQPLRKNG